MSAISCLLRPAHRPHAALARHGEIIRAWRLRWRWLLNPYRPELHYMRGPGPKWRAKHGPASAVPKAPR
jgi:hypothetical protein